MPESLLSPDGATTARLIPLRGLVLFPGALTPLVVGPDAQAVLDQALSSGAAVAFVAQRDPAQDALQPSDLHPYGCLGRVLRSVHFPTGEARMLVEGLSRVALEQPTLDESGGFSALVRPVPLLDDDPESADILAAMIRQHLSELLGGSVEQAIDLSEAIPEGPPERLADYAVGVVKPPLEVQVALLGEPSATRRLETVATYTARAVEEQRLSSQINAAVQEAMDKGQREYYLREQLKVIRQELGESDGLDDVERMRQRLDEAELPEEARAEADRELERMRRMHSDGAEYNVARTWLDWLAEMPWSRATEDSCDLRRAQAVLDADHYGLKEVKDRILEYLAVRILKPDARGMILCFVGPPGVGKTSLGESIARALGRSFQRVALGGVHDEAEIRGHRRTYIGAMPGRVIQAVKRAQTRNPLLLLDELDKLGQDFRGDPASALLEVLDPEQNRTFTDHYLAVPFDLSQVLFIATANVADGIPAPLRDRMELIELPGYMEEEKVEIARRHLVPRVQAAHGLTDQLTVTRAGLVELIRRYTREAGVRGLERELARLHRKAARKVVEGRRRSIKVTPARLPALLGSPPYHVELAEQVDRPGVAIGLAWTPVGGEILFIEAARFPGGTGQLKLTGSLGEVMKESVEAAVSLLRGGVGGLAIDPAVFKEWDFHVHVPAGAIPKDGPSAGVTMFTALASLITGRPVRSELAMTGELTLRGKVLPVGGVREKVLAARRAGVREVLLPAYNRHDLDDVPPALLRDLTVHYISDVEQILSRSLEEAPAASPGAAPPPSGRG